MNKYFLKGRKILNFMTIMAASEPIASKDFQAVLEAMTAQISVSTVVEVVAVAIGASVGLVFMWWGARKLGRMLMGAFRSGKLKF